MERYRIIALGINLDGNRCRLTIIFLLQHRIHPFLIRYVLVRSAEVQHDIPEILHLGKHRSKLVVGVWDTKDYPYFVKMAQSLVKIFK